MILNKAIDKARGSASERNPYPTPYSSYSAPRGSAIIAKGALPWWRCSADAVERNTTTSRIPAAASSLCRWMKVLRCTLQNGQPAKRRNWRWMVFLTSGISIHPDSMVSSLREDIFSPGRRFMTVTSGRLAQTRPRIAFRF